MIGRRPRVAAVSCFVALLCLLSGCATLPQNMGIRPDEPVMDTSADACAAFNSYATYAQGLQESYHSRASQNRGWLYVAGILGLGVMAASGGLAAAASVGAGTLGLLSISGAFAAGSFATLNNEALALSYTVAANSVDQSLKSARDQLVSIDDPASVKKGYTQTSCAVALKTLSDGVSDARTHLEVARTDNAAGALARAKDQLKLLNDQIAVVQAADPLHITIDAQITAITPARAESSKETSVTLTVRLKLDQGIALGDLKVALGTKEYDVFSITKPDLGDPITYEVMFKAPAARPDNSVAVYQPVLVVKGKQVKGTAGVQFTYP